MSLAPARTVSPRSSIEPGGLRVSEELLEGLAALLETGLRYRSHFLGDFETIANLVVHGPTPLLVSSPSSLMKHRRWRDAAVFPRGEPCSRHLLAQRKTARLVRPGRPN